MIRKPCGKYSPSQWDRLCKTCRLNEAQHSLPISGLLDGWERTPEELQRIAEEKKSLLQHLFEQQACERRRDENMTKFFQTKNYGAQNTIRFEADDDRVRLARGLSFVDARVMPHEILAIVCQQLGPKDKHNLKRVCVALFSRLTEYGPPSISISRHSLGTYTWNQGDSNVTTPSSTRMDWLI